MLGFLLARSGLRVAVLEKHVDFLRDFRGDTVHPSTMQVMHELGLLERFLTLPHQKVPDLAVQIGTSHVRLVDFTHLPVAAPYVAMMPQWDFLNFLAQEGRHYSGFNLMMETEAKGLIEADGKVRGLTATARSGPVEIFADLVVVANGRRSLLREQAGLTLRNLGAPMDVLWFRLPRQSDDTEETQARIEAGRVLIMLNRGSYWQCAFLISKGQNERVRAQGLDEFRQSLRPLLPFDHTRANAITDWDAVKLLTVRVDRLERWWRPGLLCLGDAAHAMSPVGGVGVNLAVQDAVAAANRLTDPLAAGTLTDTDLQAVQDRRLWPTRVTQRLQVTMQNRIIAPVLASRSAPQVPWLLRLALAIPGFRRLPARIIGLGVRPEHVRSESPTP